MTKHAAVRTRTAPIHPRRISGPTRRLAPAGAAIPRGRTGAFERLTRLPDHRVADRLLRSRACIWMIGLMLGGIVAMQVSLLRLNTGISRAVQTQNTLTLQNSSLQRDIAELSSSERIVAAAAGGRMIDPPAGETRYLTARPETDPARAVKRMRPPSDLAKAVMANGGIVPGSLAEPGSPAAALAASLTAGAGLAGATETAGTTLGGVATQDSVAGVATQDSVAGATPAGVAGADTGATAPTQSGVGVDTQSGVSTQSGVATDGAGAAATTGTVPSDGTATSGGAASADAAAVPPAVTTAPATGAATAPQG